MTLTQENKELARETVKQFAANLQEIKDLQEDNNELLDSCAKKLDVPKTFLRKAAKTHLKSNLTEVEEETRELRDFLASLK